MSIIEDNPELFSELSDEEKQILIDTKNLFERITEKTISENTEYNVMIKLYLLSSYLTSEQHNENKDLISKFLDISLKVTSKIIKDSTTNLDKKDIALAIVENLASEKLYFNI